MQQKKTPRQQKVAEEIRRVLSDFLVRGSVWNSNVLQGSSASTAVDPSMISISEVVVSSCLKHAKVFFVPISAGATSREDCLSFLEKHSPLLRHHLGSSLRLKFTPDLRFYVDHSPEIGEKISGILAKISGG
ncbi:MAG: ribosome-binding factor A [Holosporaceae bacterium]|jgi:ribosome-binding factor A|nr:ribosome-binding factor A [Holosporaceae bacterium]